MKNQSTYPVTFFIVIHRFDNIIKQLYCITSSPLIWTLIDWNRQIHTINVFPTIRNRLTKKQITNSSYRQSKFILLGLLFNNMYLRIIVFCPIDNDSILYGISHRPILIPINMKIREIIFPPLLWNTKFSLCQYKIDEFLIRQGTFIPHNVLMRTRRHCLGKSPLTFAYQTA